MVFDCIRVFVATLLVTQYCEGQFLRHNNNYNEPEIPLVPFPACRADNIDCLRRGLRSFFILMDTRHLGMRPVDPTIVNSVAISLPEQQTSFLLRRANVTGARWTRLGDRRFNLEGGKSGVTFISDLHVTGEISMTTADRIEPYIAYITMDIENVETNITYHWSGQRLIDNEDYIFIGPERIAIRNMRLPTFFVQPTGLNVPSEAPRSLRLFMSPVGTEDNTPDAAMIENNLQSKHSVLDHISNEITAAVMHTVVDNFRLFANNVPVKYYYKYY